MVLNMIIKTFESQVSEVHHQKVNSKIVVVTGNLYIKE